MLGDVYHAVKNNRLYYESPARLVNKHKHHKTLKIALYLVYEKPSNSSSHQ